MNERTCEAFRLYYENVLKHNHNNPDLLARWGRDPSRLETQVMCRKMGTKVPDSNMYQCDGEVFGPLRWPYNAATDPNYSDPPIKFQVGKRMKCIGTTGWNWKEKKSECLGFDFDSIAGHAAGVGISDEEIAKLDKIDVPWLEVVRSTRGQGRHIWIQFQEPYPVTMTHTEHAAIARAFIPLIAQHTGMDVEANVDVCGSVMWIHHDNATKENQGYGLVKPATQILTADHVPPNWRDNLEVVSGGRTKVRVQGWTSDDSQTGGDELDEMTQAHAKIELDDTHVQILEALEGTGHSSLWVHDHHLWQGHTAGLKQVFDEWAEAGHPMKGLFDTNSMDTDPGKPNCFGANTNVITRDGVKPIASLAGTTQEIITSRGKWVEAPFRSFGEQEVFAVTIENRDQSKVIHATGDHGWYVTKYRSAGYRKTKVNFGDREIVETKDLTEGRILVQTKPQCNHTPSVVGIQHGLVWGDGTIGGERTCAALSLFGEKDAELLKYFAEHPKRELTNSVGGAEVWNLPRHFKSLVPLHYDKAYLYGWLAGYFAADGCVSDSGACIIRSADKGSVEHVRQVCHILGVETSKVTSTLSSGYKESMMYTTILKAADLTAGFFLLTPHRERWASTTNRQHHYWRVVSVESAGREEVFCCTVPETHCFVLEDFILSKNCFMRPKSGGAWDVYRFGEGTQESPLWGTQGKWAHTTYNFPPTLKQICLACGGFEGPDPKQGYIFSDILELQEALALLGVSPILPDKAKNRTLALRDQDGKTVLVISKARGDTPGDFPRYAKTPQGWQRVMDEAIETSDKEQEEDDLWNELDEKFRALKIVGRGEGGSFDSWVLKDSSDKWCTHPRENVKSFLASVGYKQADPILGGAVFKCWTVINEPFQPEYPGGRMWNRDSAQFVYAPIDLSEGEMPHHPHWNKVMRHCGSDLDEYIPSLNWCKDWGIECGGDYLTAWVACMLRHPFGKLPYLFMYGPQNSGKSTFHESIDLLMTRGVEKADRALTSQSGYNGELMDTVLAVIDEVDISKAGLLAYNKVKEWTTGLNISIHAKYKQVQLVRSTLHFVQMANSRSSLPVFPGDTRITAMNVPCPLEEIPRDILHDALRKEAPHFMRTLMDIEIAEPTGRLMLPIIETQGKLEAAEGNMSELDRFIRDKCHAISGAGVPCKEFKLRFVKTLEDFQLMDWTEGEIKKQLSERFPIGRAKGNVTVIGNLSFEQREPQIPYVLSGKRLVREGEE
jgi:hypothetical protein